MAFILIVSYWVGCELTWHDINIFLLNLELFFDNLPPRQKREIFTRSYN